MTSWRDAVRERDLWRCARCGKGHPEHVHHRVLRSQGGGNGYANLVCLCTCCHNWAHHRPAEAMAGGWIVPGECDPAQVAVCHFAWGRDVLLRDDGTFDLMVS